MRRGRRRWKERRGMGRERWERKKRKVSEREGTGGRGRRGRGRWERKKRKVRERAKEKEFNLN